MIEINAQVQFIDFEGRSDGESLLKILSQLRPRRVVVCRGSPENVDLVAKHCMQNIGARVFTPNKGDIVDATTETHIYQVRLTEALISKLQFQKGKDTEVAWIDSEVVVRSKQIDTITPAGEGGGGAGGNNNVGASNTTSDVMETDDGIINMFLIEKIIIYL